MHPADVEDSPNAVLDRAVSAVSGRSDERPELGLILGSGLGPLADEIDAEAVIPYDEIPGMRRTTAPGHAGELYLGTLDGRRVVAMKGRAHLYDGIGAAAVAFPVRLMSSLGARSLLVSNACGGMVEQWRPGDLMLQTDFINATGDNPLLGPNDDSRGPRFPVLFDCYDPHYLDLARSAAAREGVTLREGVYLAISGPSYATRAELRAFRTLGADAIGMSTVHEVIVARHEGLRVLGLSVVTDMALPGGSEHATGDEVVRVAEKAGERFRQLVKSLLPEL